MKASEGDTVSKGIAPSLAWDWEVHDTNARAASVVLSGGLARCSGGRAQCSRAE